MGGASLEKISDHHHKAQAYCGFVSLNYDQTGSDTIQALSLPFPIVETWSGEAQWFSSKTQGLHPPKYSIGLSTNLLNIHSRDSNPCCVIIFEIMDSPML